MTDKATLTVRFDNPDINNDDTLRLEQEPWGDTGKTTVIDLIRGMESMFFGFEQAEPDCGYSLEGRTVSTEIYAYPSRPDLVFRIDVTMGTLSSGILESMPVVEVIDFRLQSRSTLSYLPDGGVSASWLGATYNIDGDTVPPPGVTTAANDQEVFTPEEVYGSLKVEYNTLRYRYTLTITPRVDSPENSFQATVWAAWDGGVNMLAVDAPPGAEEDLQNATNCSNRGGSNLIVNPEDEDRPLPTVEPGGEEEVYLDYCTYGEGGYVE